MNGREIKFIEEVNDTLRKLYTTLNCFCPFKKCRYLDLNASSNWYTKWIDFRKSPCFVENFCVKYRK